MNKIIKAIIIISTVLIALGFAIKSCEAKEITPANLDRALDEITDTSLYVGKLFSMYSIDFKKEHGPKAYEDLIYEDNKCVMCGKEK